MWVRTKRSPRLRHRTLAESHFSVGLQSPFRCIGAPYPNKR